MMKRLILSMIAGLLVVSGVYAIQTSSGAAGGPGSDTTAIHIDTADEFSGASQDASPESGDRILVEDATTQAKEWVEIGDLPTGTGMSNFNVAGDSGSTQNITEGNDLVIAGGTNISTVASATDTLTVNLDDEISVSTASVTNDLTVDTNTLFVDASTNKVGIGTDSPSKQLHIEGTGSTDGDVLLKNTGDNSIILNGDSNRTLVDRALFYLSGSWNGTEVGTISFQSGDDTTNKDDGEIAFSTTPSGGSITERMRIDSAGNVGIGTDSPASKLQIGGSVQSLRFNNPSVNNNEIIMRGTPDSVGWHHSKIESSRDASTFSYGSYLKFYTEGKSSGTTDTSVLAMTIDSKQNVGIGTVSPAARLEISGETSPVLRIASNSSNGKPSLAFWDRQTSKMFEIRADQTGGVFENLLLRTASETVVSINAIGVATFDELPVGPSTAPTTDYQMANKKYVDDNLLTGWTDSSTNTGTNKTLNSFTNTIEADAIHKNVFNNTGGTLTKGTAVYVSGYNAGQDAAEISKADADDPSMMPASYILEEDITNGSTGSALLAGALTNFDTSAWSAGDELYVSTTAGELTNVKPTADSAAVQKVAIVNRSNGTIGRIEVFGAGRSNDVPNTADFNGTVTSKKQMYTEGTDNDPTTKNITIDFNTGETHTYDLESVGADIDITLSNVATGNSYLIEFIQGATARQINSVTPTIKWKDNTTPTINTTADRTTIIGIHKTQAGTLIGNGADYW